MKGLVVQSAERRSPKPDVMGSNPIQPIPQYMEVERNGRI